MSTAANNTLRCSLQQHARHGMFSSHTKHVAKHAMLSRRHASLAAGRPFPFKPVLPRHVRPSAIVRLRSSPPCPPTPAAAVARRRLPAPRAPLRHADNDGTCHNGHHAAATSQRPTSSSSATPTPPNQRTMSNVVLRRHVISCWRCCAPGHARAECQGYSLQAA